MIKILITTLLAQKIILFPQVHISDTLFLNMEGLILNLKKKYFDIMKPGKYAVVQKITCIIKDSLLIGLAQSQKC